MISDPAKSDLAWLLFIQFLMLRLRMNRDFKAWHVCSSRESDPVLRTCAARGKSSFVALPIDILRRLRVTEQVICCIVTDDDRS